MVNVMVVEKAVAANTTDDNVLTGKRFERAPFDCFLKLSSSGSAAGLQEELNVGGRAVTPRNPVNTNNRIPIEPDDNAVDGVPVREGELIQLSAANTTAGALTYRARVTLTRAR
jgi:hypothetical protein